MVALSGPVYGLARALSIGPAGWCIYVGKGDRFRAVCRSWGSKLLSENYILGFKYVCLGDRPIQVNPTLSYPTLSYPTLSSPI